MMAQSLREALLRDEGCHLKPYRDSRGFLTIGVGRCLETKGISMAEAEMLLDNDLRDVFRLADQIPWITDLDEARRNVLFNMAFNLGVQGVLGFTKTLELVQQGQYVKAAAEMLKSDWAKQVPNRAARLSLQLEHGQWR